MSPIAPAENPTPLLLSMNHAKPASSARKLFATISLVATALALAFPRPALAQSYTWSFTGNGNWNTAADWDSGIPNSTDAAIVFNSGSLATARTITLNQTATIGSLTIKGIPTAATLATTLAQNGSYALTFASASGTSAITFQGPNNFTLATLVNLNNDLLITANQDMLAYAPTLTLSNTIKAAGNSLYVVNYEPLSTVTINGAITGAGSSVNKTGVGLLNLNSSLNSFDAGLNVTGGTVATTVRNVAPPASSSAPPPPTPTTSAPATSFSTAPTSCSPPPPTAPPPTNSSNSRPAP